MILYYTCLESKTEQTVQPTESHAIHANEHNQRVNIVSAKSETERARAPMGLEVETKPPNKVT